jgi:hypothetical protein
MLNFIQKRVHNMRVPVLLLSLTLVGCAGCAAPFEMYARYQNTQDPCQRQNNGGVYPEWCGAGAGKSYIYKGQGGAPIGYIKPQIPSQK